MESNTANLHDSYATKTTELYRTIYGQGIGGSHKREYLSGVDYMQKIRELFEQTSTISDPRPIDSVRAKKSTCKGEYKEAGNKEGDGREQKQDKEEGKGQGVTIISTATYTPHDLPEVPNQTLSPVLWACTSCSKTMSIFFRSEHLNSKSHTKHLREHPHSEPQHSEPVIPTWQCMICEQAVSVFYKAEHLSGKRHAKVLREKGYPPDFINNDEEPLGPTAPCQQLPKSSIRSNSITSSYDETIGAPSLPSAEVKRLGQVLANRSSPEDPPECRAKGTHTAPTGHQQVKTVRQAELQVAVTGAPTPKTFRCAICNDREFSEELWECHSASAWVCEVCEKVIHVDSKDVHLMTSKHKRLERRELLRFKNIATKPPVEYATRERTSTSTTQANSSTSVVLDTSTSTDAGIICCEVCNQSFSKNQRKRHRGRAWECTLCNTTIHLPWKKAHLAGKKHKRLAL